MKTKNKYGFTIVEIMIVVVVIGLLTAIGIPGFRKARDNSRNNACRSTQRQIETAKEMYAIESGKDNGGTVTLEKIAEYMRNPPTCPCGGTFIPGTIGEECHCTVHDFRIVIADE
ncbi:MAG: prepilin-type N-terminal cleavage/methylation domain-containing protein [Kiritimatiellales bacterium]|nr:prepilin-type N-terminal cleavage/methylation domain-containing protein [Kiritimatiellales bacterium]